MDHLATESYSTPICRKEKDLDSQHKQGTEIALLTKGSGGTEVLDS